MSHSASLPFAATLHVRDTCLCLHAQRAARILARRFDDALRPLGLTNSQFSLLVSLNRPEPPGLTAVALVLGADRTTVTAAIKPLQRRGLVEIRPDPNDRRGRRIALTQDGLALISAAYPIWEQTHREVEAELVDSRPEQLRADLKAISSLSGQAVAA
jgi:DNA-binding MarR family transcriptional regulator